MIFKFGIKGEVYCPDRFEMGLVNVKYVPLPIILPTTFNDDKHVVKFAWIVLPEIFNDDTHVEALFNVVFPETFNDDKHVVTFAWIEFPDIFNMKYEKVIDK